MTLLQYIVSTYVSKFERDLAGTDRAKLPVPEYSDVTQAMLVQFDDIEKELKKIQKDFDGTKHTVPRNQFSIVSVCLTTSKCFKEAGLVICPYFLKFTLLITINMLAR